MANMTRQEFVQEIDELLWHQKQMKEKAKLLMCSIYDEFVSMREDLFLGFVEEKGLSFDMEKTYCLELERDIYNYVADYKGTQIVAFTDGETYDRFMKGRRETDGKLD